MTLSMFYVYIVLTPLIKKLCDSSCSSPAQFSFPVLALGILGKGFIIPAYFLEKNKWEILLKVQQFNGKVNCR